MDVYRGVRWSAISGWGEHLIQLVVTLVLARLLLPNDYGLLAMAAVFIGFLDIFSSMGFGLAVVQRREINNRLLWSLFYVNLAIGGVLTLATLAAAPLFAWIYQDSRVLPLMAALSLNFLLMAPAIVPRSLLIRRMAFDRIACVQLSLKIIGGGLGITLAAMGWGVWSLVLPTVLLGSPLKTVLFFVVSGWRPRLIFCWTEVRGVLSFGANVTGFAVFNYFARNADNFIIGAFLGAGPLGYYSLAYSILLKPRDTVTSVLTRVLLPTLSRMQDDDARLKTTYLRACGAIAFVTFPMMFGLVAVAQLFVEVVLGAKWLPAVPLIYIFAPLGALQSIWVPIGDLFLAKNCTRWYFRMGIAQGCLTIGVFLAGIPWGIVGVATAYALFNVVWIPLWFWLGSKLVSGLRVRDIAGELAPYVHLSAIMYLVVVLCKYTLTAADLVAPMVLAICVAAGMIVYVGSAIALQPTALGDLVRVLPTKWTTKLIRRGIADLGSDEVR